MRGHWVDKRLWINNIKHNIVKPILSTYCVLLNVVR